MSGLRFENPSITGETWESAKHSPCWLIWQAVPKGPKLAKLPIDPKTLKTLDRSAAARYTFEDARRRAEALATAGRDVGVGYFYDKEKANGHARLLLIDFDEVLQDGKLIDPPLTDMRLASAVWMAEALRDEGIYMEVSPSAKGLRAIMAMPSGAEPDDRKIGQLEILTNRFGTVTGSVWANGGNELLDGTAALSRLQNYIAQFDNDAAYEERRSLPPQRTMTNAEADKFGWFMEHDQQFGSAFGPAGSRDRSAMLFDAASRFAALFDGAGFMDALARSRGGAWEHMDEQGDSLRAATRAWQRFEHPIASGELLAWMRQDGSMMDRVQARLGRAAEPMKAEFKQKEQSELDARAEERAARESDRAAAEAEQHPAGTGSTHKRLTEMLATMPTGMARDIASDLLKRQAIPMPGLALTMALHVLTYGASPGFVVKDLKRGYITALNFYSVSGAPTGSGKDLSLQRARQYIQQLSGFEPNFEELLDFASGVAMFKHLGVMSKDSMYGARCFFVLNEAEEMLRSFTDRGARIERDIFRTLLEAYSVMTSTKAGKRYSDGKRDIPEIRAPKLSLVCLSTLTGIDAIYNQEMAGSGMSGRMIVTRDDPDKTTVLAHRMMLDTGVRRIDDGEANALVQRYSVFARGCWGRPVLARSKEVTIVAGVRTRSVSMSFAQSDWLNKAQMSWVDAHKEKHNCDDDLGRAAAVEGVGVRMAENATKLAGALTLVQAYEDWTRATGAQGAERDANQAGEAFSEHLDELIRQRTLKLVPEALSWAVRFVQEMASGYLDGVLDPGMGEGEIDTPATRHSKLVRRALSAVTKQMQNMAANQGSVEAQLLAQGFVPVNKLFNAFPFRQGPNSWVNDVKDGREQILRAMVNEGVLETHETEMLFLVDGKILKEAPPHASKAKPHLLVRMA